MRLQAGRKVRKAREKGAQTLTLSTDPVFDIPDQPCAFFSPPLTEDKEPARNYASGL